MRLVHGRGLVFAIGVWFGIGVPSVAHAGKLDSAGSVASGSSSSAALSSASTSSSSTHHGDDTDPFSSYLALQVLLSPFTVPRLITKEAETPDEGLAWVPYDDQCGLYCPRGEGGRSRTKLIALQLGLEGGMDTSVFPMAGVDARLVSPTGLGLSTRATGFREPDEDRVDYGLLGKSHIFYQFATLPNVQFRAGLGTRYLIAPDGPHAGFDFLYAIDVQWPAHIVTDFEGDLGNVEQAFAAELRGTLGVWIDRFQIYGGWDQNWIGEVALGGPILGVRGYF